MGRGRTRMATAVQPNELVFEFASNVMDDENQVGDANIDLFSEHNQS